MAVSDGIVGPSDVSRSGYTANELMHQRLNYTSNCMTEVSYQLRELRKIPESALDSAQLGKLHQLQARVADFIEEFSGFKR